MLPPTTTPSILGLFGPDCTEEENRVRAYFLLVFSAFPQTFRLAAANEFILRYYSAEIPEFRLQRTTTTDVEHPE